MRGIDTRVYRASLFLSSPFCSSLGLANKERGARREKACSQRVPGLPYGVLLCCVVAASAVMDLAHYRPSIVLLLTCELYALKDGFHAHRAPFLELFPPRRRCTRRSSYLAGRIYHGPRCVSICRVGTLNSLTSALRAETAMQKSAVRIEDRPHPSPRVRQLGGSGFG